MAAPALIPKTIPVQALDLSVPDPKRVMNFSLPLYQGCEYNPTLEAWQIVLGQGFMKFNLELPAAQNIRLVLTQGSITSQGTTDNPFTITVNDYSLIRGFDDHNDAF